jgi:hypothetical protein
MVLATLVTLAAQVQQQAFQAQVLAMQAVAEAVAVHQVQAV